MGTAKDGAGTWNNRYVKSEVQTPCRHVGMVQAIDCVPGIKRLLK